MLAFPWGTLAATQYKNLALLQMLDLTGAYGLSFLMALLAGAAATALQGVERQASSVESDDLNVSHSPASSQELDAQRLTPNASTILGQVGLSWALGTLVLIGLLMLRSVWVMAGSKAPRETVRVALVQASESRKTAGAAVECFSPLADYETRTRTALQSGAELVLWPESACESDAINDPEVRKRLINLLWGSKAHLLAGSFVYHPDSGSTTNSAVMLSPRGRILGQYAKVLIVPFGEYLPFRPLLRWTERLGMPATDLRAGDKLEPVPWERGKIGVSICFESAFGFVSRKHVNEGANLLAVLTSDGWAGRTTAGLQHATFAPLRAVEMRRSVARAAATGVSQLIDPYGRPIQELSMFKKGVVLGDLPLRTDRTVYSRLGDWPVALAWLILVSSFLRGRRRPRPA
jgi:apolipoprotein N-acyltransferase